MQSTLFVELGAPAAPGPHSWTLERCRYVRLAELLAGFVWTSFLAWSALQSVGSGTASWSGVVVRAVLVSPMHSGCVYRSHTYDIIQSLERFSKGHVLIDLSFLKIDDVEKLQLRQRSRGLSQQEGACTPDLYK